jgi:hypothetical protein
MIRNVDIYLAVFRSIERGGPYLACGTKRKGTVGNLPRTWPYDLGDDPSFYRLFPSFSSESNVGVDESKRWRNELLAILNGYQDCNRTSLPANAQFRYYSPFSRSQLFFALSGLGTEVG